MAKGIKTGGGSRKGVPNKATVDIKAAAQEYGASALTTLSVIMEAKDMPPAARVSAAKELLDRGYGKAKQYIEASGPGGKDLIPSANTDWLGYPVAKPDEPV